MNIVGILAACVSLWFIFKVLAPKPAGTMENTVKLVSKNKRKKSSRQRKRASVEDLEAEQALLLLKVKEKKLALQLREVRAKIKHNETISG